MKQSDENPEASERQVELFATYYEKILKYFLARVGCPHDAEDLAQDVLVALMSGKNLPHNPDAYAFTAARNRLRRYRRTQTRQAGLTLIEENEAASNVQAKTDARNEYDPFHQLLTKEKDASLRRALSRIPPKSAAAIELRFIDGLSPQEVAQTIGCTPGSLHKRLQRTRRLLVDICRDIAEH